MKLKVRHLDFYWKYLLDKMISQIDSMDLIKLDLMNTRLYSEAVLGLKITFIIFIPLFNTADSPDPSGGLGRFFPAWAWLGQFFIPKNRPRLSLGHIAFFKNRPRPKWAKKKAAWAKMGQIF